MEGAVCPGDGGAEAPIWGWRVWHLRGSHCHPVFGGFHGGRLRRKSCANVSGRDPGKNHSWGVLLAPSEELTIFADQQFFFLEAKLNIKPDLTQSLSNDHRVREE